MTPEQALWAASWALVVLSAAGLWALRRPDTRLSRWVDRGSEQ